MFTFRDWWNQFWVSTSAPDHHPIKTTGCIARGSVWRAWNVELLAGDSDILPVGDKCLRECRYPPCRYCRRTNGRWFLPRAPGSPGISPREGERRSRSCRSAGALTGRTMRRICMNKQNATRREARACPSTGCVLPVYIDRSARVLDVSRGSLPRYAV